MPIFTYMYFVISPNLLLNSLFTEVLMIQRSLRDDKESQIE